MPEPLGRQSLGRPDGSRGIHTLQLRSRIATKNPQSTRSCLIGSLGMTKAVVEVRGARVGREERWTETATETATVTETETEIGIGRNATTTITTDIAVATTMMREGIVNMTEDTTTTGITTGNGTGIGTDTRIKNETTIEITIADALAHLLVAEIMTETASMNEVQEAGQEEEEYISPAEVDLDRGRGLLSLPRRLSLRHPLLMARR